MNAIEILQLFAKVCYKFDIIIQCAKCDAVLGPEELLNNKCCGCKSSLGDHTYFESVIQETS